MNAQWGELYALREKVKRLGGQMAELFHGEHDQESHGNRDGGESAGGSGGEKGTGDPNKTYSIITETNQDTALLMVTNGINPGLKPMRTVNEFSPGAGIERQGTYVAQESAFSRGSFGDVRIMADITGDKLKASPELEQLGRHGIEDALGNENGAITVGEIPSGNITSVEVYEGGRWNSYSPKEFVERSGAPRGLPKLPPIMDYRDRVNVTLNNIHQANLDAESYSRATLKEKYALAAGNGLVELNGDSQEWAFGG